MQFELYAPKKKAQVLTYKKYHKKPINHTKVQHDASIQTIKPLTISLLREQHHAYNLQDNSTLGQKLARNQENRNLLSQIPEV